MISKNTASTAPQRSQDKAKISPSQEGASMVRLRWIWLAFIFFGGIFSAALLLALNWRMMGYQRKARQTLLSITVVWLLGVFITIRITAHIRLDYDYVLRDDLRLICILALQQGVAAIIIAWHSWQQWRTARECSIAFHSDGRAFKAVGLGFVAGYFLWPIACWYVLLPIGTYLTAPFTPDRIYTNQHITMAYPPYWQDRSDWFFDQLCRTNHKEHCLTFLIGEGAILVSESDRLEHSFNPDHFDGTTLFHQGSTVRLEIDGRDALRTTYTYVIYVGLMPLPMTADRVTINDSRGSISIEFMAPIWMTGGSDRIINSIRFVDSPQSVEE